MIAAHPSLLSASFKEKRANRYTVPRLRRITALGEDSEDIFTPDPHSALRIFEERDAQRCTKWQEKFS